MITGIFGLITITALGWALYNVFAATMSSLTALASVGWAAYVGADPDNTLGFLFKCFMNSACGEVLGPQWVANYSLMPAYIFPPALIATIIAARITSRPRNEKKKPGQAHWGTTAELIREGYVKTKTNKSVRGYFGIHKDSKKIIQLPEHIRFSHCLVIGGPGARKSTGYHKQNIIQDMRDGVNIIVFDLKYPDPRGGFFDMVTLAADQYGYDVQLMLPYDQITHRYSLLAKATTETGAREVASMILPPGEGSEGSEFYRNNERILLTALILAAARKKDGSLKEIVDALRLGFQGMSDYVKKAGDPDVGTMVNTVLNGMDVEKQKGVLNGLLGKLEIFGDPDLLAFGQLSKDPRENIDLRRFANSKTILYIGIPQQKLGPNGQMFLQLIKRSIDNELGEISRENAGVFPIPISYYLDEFANFGPLPDIGADFATMRSRRLSYHVTVQNMAQGAAVYGHQEWESFYRSNFQSVLIFPRYIRFGDADLFSKFAGNLTTIEQSTSDSKGGLESRTSVSTREVSRPLMSTEEMKEWPQAEGVAFLNGVAPVRVVLPRLDEKHVRGYKNPYHQDYERIPDKLNPYEWTAERFARLAATRKQAILAAHLREAETLSAEQRAKREHQERTSELQRTATPATLPQASESDDNEPLPPTPPPAAPQPPRASPTNSPATASAPPSSPKPAAPTPKPAAPAKTQRKAPPPPAQPQPKGVKRFNLYIGSLINARITPSVVKVSKGKRLLELAFPLTPDVEARLEPYRDLLVKRSKFMVYRKGEIALTRAGLAYMTDNFTAYYYRQGVKHLSRQQRAALADPQGPDLQLPMSHNAAKRALRKEIRRLAKAKRLQWRQHEGEQVLTAPIGQVDANRLLMCGAYWKQLALAVERDGLLIIRPKALVGLPQPVVDSLPARPQPKPKPKPKPAAPQSAPEEARKEEAPTAPPAPERPRGNDPRAAAKRLHDAPPFPEEPRPQDNRNEAEQSVEDAVAPAPEPAAAAVEVEPAETAPQTPSGLKPMPDFVKKPAAVIVQPGQESHADTIALATGAFDRARVHEWVEKNKEKLIGHPDAPENLNPGASLGTYTGVRYLIPHDTALERLRFSNVTEVPERFKRVTHRLGGKVGNYILFDTESGSGSEEIVLVTAIEGLEDEFVASTRKVEEIVELPLDEAVKLLEDVEWQNIQAEQRGRRAWVTVYVVDPNFKPSAPAATIAV